MFSGLGLDRRDITTVSRYPDLASSHENRRRGSVQAVAAGVVLDSFWSWAETLLPPLQIQDLFPRALVSHLHLSSLEAVFLIALFLFVLGIRPCTSPSSAGLAKTRGLVSPTLCRVSEADKNNLLISFNQIKTKVWGFFIFVGM